MSDFLYPFLAAAERDVDPLLTDLAGSAEAKSEASAALRVATLERAAAQIEALAAAMAERFRSGGRLFTFGNGGSSTDAASLASLFARPPWGRPLPARCLVDDPAVLTALGNDVGFELVFSRQLIAHAGAGDIAVGLSTSGGSANVLRALAEARARGLLTAGLAGYGGGELGRHPDVQHRLVVESDSVHRIQETQAAIGFALWTAVQVALGDAGRG